VRWEWAGPTELGVSDYDAVDHGDEYVVRACPLVEEPCANRWRGGGGEVVSPRGGVLPENLLVPELSSTNRYHADRMAQKVGSPKVTCRQISMMRPVPAPRVPKK